MTSIISANWKMNGSKELIDSWFELFFVNTVDFEKQNDLSEKDIPIVVLCVPAVFLDYVVKKAESYNSKTKYFKVLVGAENCHNMLKGAFTGDTSVIFVKEIGCDYAIVGHSERRQYYAESDELVSKKAVTVVENKLIPIVCVGESLQIRESNKHFEFVGEQIINSTVDLDMQDIVIAYEPLWAIGTGKVPSENDIDEMSGYIKEILSKTKNVDKKDVRVLYGGSVKSDNSHAIIHLDSVDGVLVGGASLKGDEFFKIVVSSL